MVPLPEGTGRPRRALWSHRGALWSSCQRKLVGGRTGRVRCWGPPWEDWLRECADPGGKLPSGEDAGERGGRASALEAFGPATWCPVPACDKEALP